MTLILSPRSSEWKRVVILKKGGINGILPEVLNLREDFDLALAHPGVGRKLGYQDLPCHGLFGSALSSKV
jgi:hypothetical protein